MLGDIGVTGNCIVAVIFFLVGLNLFGVIPMPWSNRCRVGIQLKGFLPAFIQ